MRKLSIILLSIVLLFTFSAATFAKGKEKSAKVDGAITAVDTEASTVTVKAKGSTVQLTLDSSSKLKIKDLKSPTLADIWVGDQAKATYVQKDKTNLVSEIEITKKKGSLKGAIESVDAEGLSITLTGGKKMVVTDKTTIKLSKEKLAVTDLVQGDLVTAKGYLKDGVLQATEIEVKRIMATLKGKVESIQADKNQLVVAGKTVKVATSTKIHLMNVKVTLADLIVGDQVVVVGAKKSSSFEAKIINVNRKLESLEGAITAVDATNKTITVGDKVLTVTDQTKLVQEDEAITLDKLQVGSEVEAKGYVSGEKWIAVKVNVKTEDDGDDEEQQPTIVTGSIEQIDFTAKTLVVAGKSVSFTDTTVVTDDKDQTIAVTDLTVGLTVEVTGTWNEDQTTLTAEKIKVQVAAVQQ